MLAFTDRARVWVRLMRVSKRLCRRDSSQLSLEQQARRSWALDELDRYRRAGGFPKNTYVGYRTPIFEDESGRRCAVAHLVSASGGLAVVESVRARGNLARIRQIDDPRLPQWANDHGLTVDELAEIQPGYDAPGIQAWYVILSALSLACGLFGFVGFRRRDRSSKKLGMLAAVLSLALAVALATKMMTIGVTDAIPRFGFPVAGFLLVTSSALVFRWIWRETA